MLQPEHRSDWQSLLSGVIRSSRELLQMLDIDPALVDFQPDQGDFPLRVPVGFARRMKRGDLQDPLLRQVLPVNEETRQVEGYSHDPLAEQAAMAVPGLLHKYRGRALLTVTGACAIHCRYCFRRHYPYSEANPLGGQLEAVLDYLRSHTDLNEIILSGGDPLSLPTSRLRDITDRLAAIPHLETLRIHTRLPIVLPERVDSELLELLHDQRMNVVVVLHSNHGNELDAAVESALRSLSACGITLLNQSVLLRGVNDKAEALIELSRKLFAAGALPYYLHQLDPVAGAAHFAVTDSLASELLAELRAALPGYLVPRLVRELAGASGKTPLL